jgi:hypothetical protein
VAFYGTNVSPIEIRELFGEVEHVCTLFGSEKEGDTCSLLWNIETYLGRIPKELLPIGDDPYGNLHCLGIRSDEAGKIYFWDHEGPGEEDDWRGITLVAHSFADFIDRLIKEEE